MEPVIFNGILVITHLCVRYCIPFIGNISFIFIQNCLPFLFNIAVADHFCAIFLINFVENGCPFLCNINEGFCAILLTIFDNKFMFLCNIFNYFCSIFSTIFVQYFQLFLCIIAYNFSKTSVFNFCHHLWVIFLPFLWVYSFFTKLLNIYSLVSRKWYFCLQDFFLQNRHIINVNNY